MPALLNSTAKRDVPCPHSGMNEPVCVCGNIQFEEKDFPSSIHNLVFAILNEVIAEHPEHSEGRISPLRQSRTKPEILRA